MAAVVEDARPKDLEAMYKIEKDCFDDEAFTKEQIAHLMEDYNTVSLVARIGTELAGFVIGMVYIDRRALQGHILTIDVAPAHRRKGIGRMLMSAIESIFRAKGVTASFLEVREDNSPAIGLYSRLGYRIIGRLDHYYGKFHGVYLSKTLT